MPLIRCTKDGKSGWKVKNVNKCWTGPDAKKKALHQWMAIEPQKFGLSFKIDQADEFTTDDLLEVIKTEKDIDLNTLNNIMVALNLNKNEIIEIMEVRGKL